MDLFSLYLLFTYFTPRDATLGNSFFQMSSYARANVRIRQKENSHDNIKSEMGKQNIQTKKVPSFYCCKYIDVIESSVEFESSALVNLFVIGFYSQMSAHTANLD